MSDRAAVIAKFLAGTGFEHWQQVSLAGDASTRSYLRLVQGDEAIILMDATPSGAKSTETFVQIADWLSATGLAAPKILKGETNAGLLLLEDLGQTDFADHLRNHPPDTTDLYAAATDVLIHLHQAKPPDSLTVMTPEVGGQMLDVTLEWYAEQSNDQSLIHAMTSHLAALCEPATDIALRDYHAENLIWRPDLTGLAKVGLLDFQDAFLAPRGYDLVSLLRDVRREVSPDICAKMTGRFADATGELTPGAFSCLAVQRNLRILGVFARLARRDGKHRYMQMIPHLWSLITADLAHPALADLKRITDTCLPPPEHSAIKDLL